MASITCPECGAELLAEESSGKVAVCPYCGAQVHININVNYNFNYSKSEHTERIIDEARSKSADNVNRVIGIFATPFEEYRAKKDHERRMEEEEQRMSDERIRRYEEQIRSDKEYARARQEERERQWRAVKKKFFKLCKRHPKETLITLVVCTLALIIGVSEWSNYATKKQQQLQHGAELARLEHEQIAYSHLADGEVQMPDINTADDYRIVRQDFEDAGFTNITTEAVADLTNTTTARYNRVIEVTIDGVPRLKVGNWYPMDVPIVITYHTVGDTILTPEQEAWSIAHGLLHGADNKS